MHRTDIPARFGVMKRHPDTVTDADGGGAKPAVQWIETDACGLYHFANAWEEEGGRIVRVFGCRSEVGYYTTFTILPYYNHTTNGTIIRDYERKSLHS